MPRFLTRIGLLFCFISLENLTSYVLEGLLGCLNMLDEKIPKYSPQPDLMVDRAELARPGMVSLVPFQLPATL